MKKCLVVNCNEKYYGKGYCQKHYWQLKRHGHILERSRKDPNEFVIIEDICKIKLYNNQGEIKAETVIDAEDYEKCKNIKWTLLSNGYVNNKKYGYLHHFVLNFKFNGIIQVDHKDRNKLNNRKKNLRFCVNRQNSSNAKKSKNNTSNYKGVCWHKNCKKWRSRIWVNNKCMHLGYFDNIIEAARAYNEAAVRYHGEFANLNPM
jgi:hypothetical protein